VCSGCKEYSIGSKGKVSYLHAHASKCSKLKEIMSKEKDCESFSSTKSTEAANGNILDWLTKGKDEAIKQNFCDAWLLFCLKTNLGYRALERPEFVLAAKRTREAGGVHSITHKEMKTSLRRLRMRIAEGIKAKMAGKYVTVMFDGWKVNHRKEHAHAFMFSDWEGNTVFHSLDGDLEFQGHEYIVKLLTKKTKEIEEMYDVRVVAGVGDNASVMDKSLAEFAQTRPFFVHHCSAHWVQLILNDISENALVQKSMDACARIRSIFNKKVNLKTLQDVCKALRKSITRLAYPCTTRWSSELDAMIKLLHLETEIFMAMKADGFDSDIDISSDDFMDMRVVCKTLIPLAIATDHLQSDESGLVMEVSTMVELEETLERLGGESKQDLPHQVLEALYQRNTHANWEENKRLHGLALLLSVKPGVLEVENNDMADEGVRVLLEEGPAFLKKHCDHLSDKSFSEIKEMIETQIATYSERNEGSSDLRHIDMKETVRRWGRNSIGSLSLLARIAKIVFSIRSSEAAVERSFSRAAFRLTPRRNRLKLQSLSDELFISINSDEKKTLPMRRRARIVPPPPPPMHGECECEHESDPDLISIVDEMDLEEIPTKCLPLRRRDDLPNEDMLQFTKCHSCGEILGQYDDDDAMDPWWCCCKCLSEFCPHCSDAFLTDESGLCHECDDPDAAILHAIKSRKRSAL
jgi:hypothetical protein